MFKKKNVNSNIFIYEMSAVFFFWVFFSTFFLAYVIFWRHPWHS